MTSPCNVSCGPGYQASTREMAQQQEGDTRCEGETFKLTECYQEEDCELGWAVGTLIPPSLLHYTFLFTVILLFLFLLNLILIIFLALR